MKYVNAKNTVFLVKRDCMFNQFLAKVYEVLQIKPNAYSMTIKTILRSSNTIYHACSLPMDIFNDKMAKVVLHMASDVVNYGCISIFFITSPRVPAQDPEPLVETETSFRVNDSVSDIEEDVLPQQILLQQHYSLFHENNDTIDENDITLANVEKEVLLLRTSLGQHYSPLHNNDFHSNDGPVDDTNNTKVDNAYLESFNSMQGMNSNSEVDSGGIGHSDIPINDEDEY